MANVRMVPLVTGSTPFEAKVLAARLGAEGILWELRGEVDSIYPVGRGVDVLVSDDDLASARELLLGDEVDAVLDDVDERDVVHTVGPPWWLVVVALLVLLAFTSARFVGLAT